MAYECAGCNGGGCDECNGRGEIVIEECPLDHIGPDVWSAIEMSDLCRRGMPPIQGGALDQCAKFLDAYRFVLGEQTRNKAELQIEVNE